MRSKTILDRTAAMKLAKSTFSGDLAPLRALATSAKGFGTWSYYAARLLNYIENGGPAPFRIFGRGNSKLPFSTFSALPMVSCPGAGACAKFCYSFTAWRYPAAYFRQLQNSWILANRPDAIAVAFGAIPAGTLRLYVDGDFNSVATVKFWMDLLKLRPDVQAYGYSKSWLELIGYQLAGHGWPANYRLNLSSGSKHGPEIRAVAAALPVTRGEFVAVPVERVHISNRSYQGPDRPGWAEYRKAVQAAVHDRVFVCRGKCGSCLPGGRHACGDARMTGVKIAIGVH